MTQAVVKPLTWQDYYEISHLLLAMHNLLYALDLADSQKVETLDSVRERIDVTAHMLRLKEERRKK